MTFFYISVKLKQVLQSKKGGSAITDNLLPQFAGIFAAVLAVFSAIPYTYAIIQGHRTSYATWIVWFVVGTTAFFFHFETGATDSIWLPLLYALVPAWYLILLRYLSPKWEMDRLEKFCIAAAALCWLIWVASQKFGPQNLKATIPLVAIVAVDAFGSVPIIIRAWKGQENENSVSWCITGIATSVELLAVDDWHSGEAIYPTYLAVAMGLIAIFANTRKSVGITVPSY